MAEPRRTAASLLKLAVVSLAVGLLLAAFDVTPDALLDTLAGIARGAWNAATDLFGWAGPYMLLGALVVLPAWLLGYLWKRLRGRR